MKWILIILFLSMFAAVMGLWFVQDPGQIEIIWLGYELQLSLALGFLFCVFFFSSLFLCIRVLSWFLGMPFRWLSSIKKAKLLTAKYELVELLSSYEAELFSDALFHQKKAARRLSTNPLFLWISGMTFEKAEKHLEAEKCFLELVNKPSTAFLGLKGQIRSALHRGDIKSAYGLLQHTEKFLPKSPWVLKHLLAISREQKNFKKASSLILRLEDLGYFTTDQSKKQLAYLQFREAMQSKTSEAQKESLLRQSHYLDPSLNEATEIFAQLLFDKGHKSYALSAIEATWNLAPTQKLGKLYLKIIMPKSDVDAYQVVCKLVKNNPNHCESLTLLSSTAVKAKLWGEARVHLSTLLSQNPTAEAYRLLATLELEEHQDYKAALKWLEEGLNSPRHI
jgi:HemY protein